VVCQDPRVSRVHQASLDREGFLVSKASLDLLVNLAPRASRVRPDCEDLRAVLVLVDLVELPVQRVTLGVQDRVDGRAVLEHRVGKVHRDQLGILASLVRLAQWDRLVD